MILKSNEVLDADSAVDIFGSGRTGDAMSQDSLRFSIERETDDGFVAVAAAVGYLAAADRARALAVDAELSHRYRVVALDAGEVVMTTMIAAERRQLQAEIADEERAYEAYLADEQARERAALEAAFPPDPPGHTLFCREVCTGDDPDECCCGGTFPGEY
jgi:hypothetical protein